MRATRRTDFKEEQVHHPRLPCLRATIQLKQIILSAWRGHIFLSCAKIFVTMANGSGDLGFSACQAWRGSHCANGKLHSWPVRGEATWRLLKTYA
jgi:hypothetical protein